MLPSFNTAGVCIPGEHYMLPPERRLGRVMQLIDERKFFTLQSGRQTGKTTSARWLARHYNQGDRYRAIWVDIQTAREEPDPTAAFRTVIESLDFGVETWLGDVGVPPPSARSLENPTTVVLRYVQDLAARCRRPLVVLIDEADGLVGPAMVSFLTQLRQGYLARSDAPFPHSVALIGARAVRDCVFAQEDRRAVSWLGTTSPFNVAAEAITLGPFTRDEVEELLLQHTTTTGQRFEPEAIAAIYHLSQGQPWLVNALARQLVEVLVQDRATAITVADVDAAQEILIRRQDTHLDSLAERLREPRIRSILEPMLAGEPLGDVPDDDLSFAQPIADREHRPSV